MQRLIVTTLTGLAICIQDEYGDFESKYTGDEMMLIRKELFPEITGSMGPVEVKLTIKTSSMGVITSK